MNIRICNSFENLRYYLNRANNHYCDRDTLRFFRSREVATLGNGSTAVYWETMACGFSRADGRCHKVTQFTFAPDGTVESKTLYDGKGETVGMATQRKRAQAAAHSVYAALRAIT